MGTPPPTSELQQSQPQALHYALANAQQVQIHQIGEDGQVQVVRIPLLHGGGGGCCVLRRRQCRGQAVLHPLSRQREAAPQKLLKSGTWGRHWGAGAFSPPCCGAVLKATERL